MLALLYAVACTDAQADPPVAWDYAFVDVFPQTSGVLLKVEPASAAAGGKFPTEIEALNSVGAAGWEILAPMPNSVYLAKRRR